MSAIPGIAGFYTSTQVPFSERQPNGRMLHGFADREAFDRVMAGYACGQCLAIYTMYFAVCPLCGTKRDVQLDVKAAPQDWQAYFDEHNFGSGATETRTMEDVLRDLHDPANVEQVPLKGLMPSKRGRGRPR